MIKPKAKWFGIIKNCLIIFKKSSRILIFDPNYVFGYHIIIHYCFFFVTERWKEEYEHQISQFIK